MATVCQYVGLPPVILCFSDMPWTYISVNIWHFYLLSFFIYLSAYHKQT